MAAAPGGHDDDSAFDIAARVMDDATYVRMQLPGRVNFTG